MEEWLKTHLKPWSVAPNLTHFSQARQNFTGKFRFPDDKQK